MSGPIELEVVASQALESVLRVLGLEAGSIMYVDANTQELVLLSELGLTPELAQDTHVTSSREVCQGLSGMVAQSGEPLLLEDMSQDPRIIYKVATALGFHAWVGIPLKVLGEVVGVITGLSRHRRTFIPADKELMTSLGNMAGISIANARLFKQVEATGEELRQTADDLARSNDDLEQFASVASHDLQEPLRMVESYVQLLARRYRGRLDADADEFIGFAVEGTTRMQTLINDLLEHSRMGAPGKPLEPTDSSAVLDRALENLKAGIRKSGAEVTRDFLPTVPVDPSQLVQLFQNLVGNAIKFQGLETPRVHISAEQREAEWVFSVCDNGIGLDPQFADRIFTIFQRLHAVGEYPGTGMGLAICKRIVERHGGRIWVESEPEKGSTFYFTLPVQGHE